MPATDRREQILDGAARALARHGLGKLGMNDVSASAAVSRGTVYRYFSSREELLTDLAEQEGRRFQKQMAQALRDATDGAQKVELAFRYAARYAGEHPVLRRMVETDPAFVLAAIRERFPAIQAMIREPLAPVLATTEPVRRGLTTADQLLDWMTRLMISAFLLPDPDPDRMARDLAAVFRTMTAAAGNEARMQRQSSRQRASEARRARGARRRNHGNR